MIPSSLALKQKRSRTRATLEAIVRTAETELRMLPPPPECRSFWISHTPYVVVVNLRPIPGRNCSEIFCFSLHPNVAAGLLASDQLLFVAPLPYVSRDHGFVFSGSIQVVRS